MGIKGFSSWLRTTFPVAFTNVKKLPCTFDEVYIDLNSFLYKSAAHSSTAKQVLRQLEIKLLNTLKSVRARKRIFISIDGVAPVAKLDVQRERRASKALEAAKSRLFDAQNFTPGCLFMGKVEETLKKIGEKYTRGHGPDFEFIVSGASVKEEGEIKIARELAFQHQNHGHGGRRIARAVLTLDSDALLQAFVYEIPSLFILNTQDLKGGVGCFSGEILRDAFKGLFKVSDHTIARQLQLDFTLLSIFSGNDCLPSMPFGNITYIWPKYVAYIKEGGAFPGLVDPASLMINPAGLAAFAKHLVAAGLDGSTAKLHAKHIKDRPTRMTNDAILDYLKSVQWSFSRLLGSPVAQSLSLFLSPHPPTFYELAEIDAKAVAEALQTALEASKDNKLDKKKVPGAAAIMMLDPTSPQSVGYIARPLHALFKAFHEGGEHHGDDDHARYKKLCQAIAGLPKEEFSEEELAVTFARMPVVWSRRKETWKVYDPPNIREEAAREPAAGIMPCPLLASLYSNKSVDAAESSKNTKVTKAAIATN